MRNNNQCTIWEHAKIIDLPYLPFEAYDETEKKIINYISNEVIKISKNELRKKLKHNASKSFNFNHTKTIVAIDISNISCGSISYIENLLLLTHIYPFILINCYIDIKKLLTLALHRELLKKNYILPIFKNISSADFLFATKRYGIKFFQLITGKIKKLHKNQITNIDVLFSSDDLIQHFSGLKKEGDYFFFNPEINWVGVECNCLCNLLNHLFLNNIYEFRVSQSINDFNVNSILLKNYIEKSMLFEYIDEDTFKFRFTKEKIISAIMTGIIVQFENKMTEEKAIDTTNTDFANFKGTFIEKHTIGKLFKSKDSYSFKMLSYIKKCFYKVDYDCIVIIDNGHEEYLCNAIPVIFGEINVVRITNFFGEPCIYPFNKFDKINKAIVIADVINTSVFINKTNELIVKEFKIEISGIFTFILNTKANVLNILSNNFFENKPVFNYYILKDLDDINLYLKQDHENRFRKNSIDKYLMFWQNVDSFCNIEREFSQRKLPRINVNNNTYYLKAIFTNKFNFTSKYLENNNNHDFFNKYLIWLISKYKINFLITDNNESTKFIEEIINKINIKLEVFDLSDDLFKKNKLTQKNILFFQIAFNTKKTLVKFIENILKYNIEVNNIIALSLFSRNCITNKTSHYLDILFKNIQDKVKTYSFYESKIPFYLIDTSGSTNDPIESSLKSLKKVDYDRT